MKTLILSDIHLDASGKQDEFLCDFLNKERFDYLILAGDILDVWKSPLNKILKANQKTLGLMSNIKTQIRYVLGNHDPSATDIITTMFVPVTECIKHDGHYIIHGHEFDEIIRNHSRLARLAYRAHIILNRRGINLSKIFDRFVHSVARFKDRDIHDKISLEMEYKAIDKYKKLGCNGLVMGHTHYPVCNVGDDFTYINAGSLEDGTYVQIVNGVANLCEY